MNAKTREMASKIVGLHAEIEHLKLQLHREQLKTQKTSDWSTKLFRNNLDLRSRINELEDERKADTRLSPAGEAGLRQQIMTLNRENARRRSENIGLGTENARLEADNARLEADLSWQRSAADVAEARSERLESLHAAAKRSTGVSAKLADRQIPLDYVRGPEVSVFLGDDAGWAKESITLVPKSLLREKEELVAKLDIAVAKRDETIATLERRNADTMNTLAVVRKAVAL